MKRFCSKAISIFLILSTLFGMVPVSAITTRSAVLLGDADGNGSIELLDVYAIEAHLSGETVALNAVNADVNQDSVVDKEDVRLIKEYLAGNLALTMETVTITLDPNGGSDPTDPDAFDPITVGKGYPIVRLLPTPEREGAVFVGWLDEEGNPFYQHDPIMRDITLTADYQQMAARMTLHIDSFALTEQEPDVAIEILGEFETTEAVKALLTLETMDGGDPVEPVVTAGDGVFIVKAPYRAGGSYSLTLGEGLTFPDKEEAIRTLNLTIIRDEYNDLRYNPNLIFVEDTDEMTYAIVGGDTVAMLVSSLISTGESADPLLTGSFTMTHAALEAGDLVCIYETVHPRNRDYASNDYSEDSLAYIRITAVDGDTYTFITLGEDDLEDVLFMPDMIPYLVSGLPQGETGTVSMLDYAMGDRALMGIQGAPEFNQGDYLVFYTDPLSEITDETQIAYGQITRTDGETVYYEIVTVEEMTASGGMFVHQEIDAADILDPQNQQNLMDNVVAQVQSSGFAIQAAQHMLNSTLATETARDSLLEAGYSPEEIVDMRANPYSLTAAAAGGSEGKAKVTIDGTPEISVGIIYDNRFEKGVGIELSVRVVLSLDKNPPATVSKKPTLKFDLSATFVQEIAIDAFASVDLIWGFWGPLWVPRDLHVNAYVDVKNYTNVSVGAKIYSVNEDNEKFWKKNWTTQGGGAWGMANEKILTQANALATKAWRLKQKGDELSETYLEQAKQLYDSLPQVQCGGNLYSVQDLEALLGGRSVDAEMDEVMSAQDKAEYKVGLDQLMDRYTEMLGQESDWLTLLTEEVMNETIQIECIAITIKANIVIQANINLALGADLEYQVGKRFSFWFKVADKQSGSSQMDLLDEHFGFQFYVMGALGLRAGVQADIAIGLLSTKIASIGGTFEFGPYVKLWGYFIFIHTAHRNAGSAIWDIDEELMGALFLEFGLYITIKFKAQIADGAFSYTPTLYHGEFPLLEAGVQRNVYDFAHSPGVDEGDLLPPLLIKDNDNNSANGIVMQLPDSYMRMKNIDLREGVKREEVYPADKFLFSVSSSLFSVNENGRITVSPPVGARYAECYLTITWKQDKMTFSTYGISITVPLIWTNYTTAELEERFDVLVGVGSLAKGYDYITSFRVSRLDVFDLPTREEVLAKIKYSEFDRYDGNGNLLGNAKYSAVGGYGDIPTQGLKVTRDSTYYFDVTEHTYTLKVHGVQPGNQTRTFTTTYGQPFGLSALQSTGTNDTQNGKYTVFRSLTLDPDGDGEIFSLDSVVDSSFVDRHGQSRTATVYAQYDDIGLTATYKFTGVPGIPEYSVAFKKGTVPATITELSSYVLKYNDKASILSVAPFITAMNIPVSYDVTCEMTEKEASVLTMETYVTVNGSSTVTQTLLVGTPVYPPTNLSRTGYALENWYTDEAFERQFEAGTPMPAGGLTLYAKWVPMPCTLSLDPGQETGVSGMPTSKSITVKFDSAFGQLPVLRHNDFKFLGWFTAKVDGVQITADTVFTDAGISTLYAVWGDKSTINSDWFDKNQQGAADENDETKGIFFEEGVERSFEIILKDAHENVTSDMFTIEYKLTDGGDYIPNNGKPVNAGTYDVKITGPFDNNDYMPMNELVISSGLVINKATMTLTGYPIVQRGLTTVVPRPDGIMGDGEITYTIDITYSEGAYEKPSNNTGVFYDLDSSASGNNRPDKTYEYSVTVAETENYKAASFESSALSTGNQTFSGGALTLGSYAAWLRIGTGEKATDSAVKGQVLRSSEDATGSVSLNIGNDFESYSVQTYPVERNSVPWDVLGYRLDKPSSVIKNTWDLNYTIILLQEPEYPVNELSTAEFDNSIKSFQAMDCDSYTLQGEKQVIWKTNAFKRRIESVDDFHSGGDDTINLTELISYDDTGKGTVAEGAEYSYLYSWSGKITDQYYEDYLPQEYYSYPTFTVTSDDTALERFIAYTGASSFEIDQLELARYVLKKGIDSFTYTITLAFPEDTTIVPGECIHYCLSTCPYECIDQCSCECSNYHFEGEVCNESCIGFCGEDKCSSTCTDECDHDYTNVFTKTISVEVPKPPAVQSIESIETASLPSAPFSNPVNTFGLSASALAGNTMRLSAASAPMTVAVDGVSAAKGDTIDIPVRLSGDASVWGLLMDVSCDTRSLELLGYTVGDVFTEGMFTFHNDLAGTPYKFLATRSGLEEVSADGLLLTLRFKVRDTAMAASSVSLRVLQAVAADGSLVSSYGNSGMVKVTGGMVIEPLPEDPGEDVGAQGPTPGTAPQPEDWANPFTDVREEDWFYEHVKYTALNGLFQGTSATTFSPQLPMTRAMMVTVMWRMAGSPAVTAANPFTDVAPGVWYTDAILWAAEKGIVSGYGNGLFGPSDSIVREQMAAILARYAVAMGITLPQVAEAAPFEDAANISDWATAPVDAMQRSGMIQGKPGNLFDPKGKSTRAEVAAVLHRFLMAAK